MPARKTQTKASAKSKKVSTKARGGPLPPYGVPIREAMARGNRQEMRAVAASSRKWLADVNAALAKLDAHIKKTGA